MHATDALAEAGRLMTICNSCRYCEALCAVFPSMELRRGFADGDLTYLANLCHGCGACYFDCQFAPPHEFGVNVPRTMAKVRADSYAATAWPASLRGLFARNGLAVSLATALAVTGFILAFAACDGRAVLFGPHTGAGSFYALMPHTGMVLLFGTAFLYAIVAIGMGVRAFWRDIAAPLGALAEPRWLWRALSDSGRLRYLGGGGVGCMNADERPTDRRRLFHHLTFYGFLLCLAATSVATGYHYAVGREAPYAWYELPVVLGALGGIGLLAGPVGLLVAKTQRDPALGDAGSRGLDTGFTVLLLLTGLTGMALLLLRDTPVMGPLLALHLGVVFALFVTLPYGKFVHGIYRFAALIRHARERHSMPGNGDTAEL